MSHLLTILDDFICKVEPEWKAMHRVADKRLKVVADVYEKALLRLRTSIDVDKLSEESIAMMADKIDWLIFEAACDEAYDLLGLILVDAGTEAAKYLSNSLMRLKTNSVNKAKPIVMPVLEGGERDIQLTGMFNIRNPRAAAWAATHVGENIRQVNDATRKGVQVIITDALQHGGHPYETARLIRQHIGLTEKQTKGILNYQAKLDEEGRPQAQVDRMVDAQIRRKIRARSVMIARTETQAAACAGQQLHWEDQMSKGYLNNQDFQKEWIVTPDDRLCPICAAMDGKRTDIDGVFEGGNKTPPLHVCCRCSISIVEREGHTLQEYAGTAIGQDWTKVDRLAGIIPQLATLPGKVKDLVKPKTKVPPNEEVKPVKPKKVNLKNMTPEERIKHHSEALDKMDEKEFGESIQAYLRKNGYSPFYFLNKVGFEQRKAVVKQTIELQEKYPMKKKLASFEFADFGEKEKGTYAWYKPNSHSIQLNLQHYQDTAKLEAGYARDVKSGYHPSGTKADSILTHEYGHAVHYDMKGVAERGMPMDMMTAMSNDQDITYLFKKKSNDILRVLGRYATKNEREFFAEGFAQMHHVGKDTNEYTKFVYSIVKGG